MRQKVVAGNWKMNYAPQKGAAFIKEIAPRLHGGPAEVVFCVPFTGIQAALEAASGSAINIGAQNVHYEASGAYTGEVSAEMLTEMGVRYAIIGHSERRQFFGETDETVNKRLRAAIAGGITPIVCLGENLTQREQGVTADWVRMQARIAFIGVSPQDAAGAIIAYEPIWAIGTGKTATCGQAQEVCAVIHEVMGDMYGKGVAEAVRVLYGGSVNGGNAAELFSAPDIDGGLVGGASLKLEFADIVNSIK